MKYAILTIAFLLAASLNACNTVEGVGEDVAAGGHAVERTANQSRP